MWKKQEFVVKEQLFETVETHLSQKAILYNEIAWLGNLRLWLKTIKNKVFHYQPEQIPVWDYILHENNDYFPKWNVNIQHF